MIRPAVAEDAAAIADVHVASWRSTYRRLVPDVVLDTLDVARRHASWRNILEDEKLSTFVKVADEAIVGFANGGPAREHDPFYTGGLYALYLLEAAQKRGYGHALFLAGVRTLLEQGHTSMMLWVLSTNPARGFYEAMGGKALRTKAIEIGGVTLEETAYGYADLLEVLES